MNQVLLVSDQQMPNFLPILNPGLKPDSVTLVVSEKMRNRAEWLKREIAKHQVEILPDIEIGANAADIPSITETLLEWSSRKEVLFENSILNVTGGTKPMAIAAQEIFRMGGRPVFYVDIASDKVTWINKEGEAEAVQLVGQPTLNQFFGLSGITIISGEFKSVVENERWRYFYNEIVENPQKWACEIGALNGIAGDSEQNNTLDFNVPQKVCRLPHWTEMTALLDDNELLSHQGSRFRSGNARRFCNGIWLEHYVFELLKSFGFDKKHALMNVKIRDEKGNGNELDAVLLHRNTCYVIEDKTRNMRGATIADNAVYKLAQLSSVLGLRAKGILVSARNIRSTDKERAKVYGVEVLDRLPDLKGSLARIFAS